MTITVLVCSADGTQRMESREVPDTYSDSSESSSSTENTNS